jgi:flagellin FlaB
VLCGVEWTTGLETAIILIAFVVVAAVFAYATLSAGLFSTQKGQEAVYSGLKEAQSTLELRGNIIATANQTGIGCISRWWGEVNWFASKRIGYDESYILDVTIIPGLAAGNSKNKIVISYVDQDQEVKDLYWTVTKLGNSDDDNLLEQGEKFEITLGDNTSAGNLIHALTPDLTVNKTFSIGVLTPAGAVLIIERTMPGYIDQVINLH